MTLGARARSTALLTCLWAGLLGCTPIPEVEAAKRYDAPAPGYPRIIPIEQILSTGNPSQVDPEEADLTAREEALDQRADTVAARGADPFPDQARIDALRDRAEALRAR